ncbi:hypothetical protein F5I97DRAFT_1019734 [Phlebopus sp. FC_14]|nr:hypothetical protein F5I97DRAFT_1019734 [Phlebopus sp. FC_14]
MTEDDHGLPGLNMGNSARGPSEPIEPSIPQEMQSSPPGESASPDVSPHDEPEHIHVVSSNSGDSARGTEEKPLLAGSELHSTFPRSQENPYNFDSNVQITPPPPARSRDGRYPGTARRATVLSQIPQNASGIDYIVPVEEKPPPLTVGKRLEPTIEVAVREREKYAKKATFTRYALNIATALQVLLGALTTGLSVAVTSGVAISVLGGMSTLVASYLARSRGSSEPELSVSRVKDLDQFLREIRAFQMDHGHEYASPDNDCNRRIEEYRQRFEQLLGNASGERKLSPPV